MSEDSVQSSLQCSSAGMTFSFCMYEKHLYFAFSFDTFPRYRILAWDFSFNKVFFFFFPPLFPCSHFFQREMCNHPFLCSFIQYVSLFLDCFYYFAVVLILSNVECDLMFSSCSCALKLLTWYPWAWRIYQFGNLLVIKSSNNFLSPLLLWELQLQVYWAAWSLPTAHPSSECFLLRYTATHRFSFFYCCLPVHKSFLQQYVTCR